MTLLGGTLGCGAEGNGATSTVPDRPRRGGKADEANELAPGQSDAGGDAAASRPATDAEVPHASDEASAAPDPSGREAGAPQPAAGDAKDCSPSASDIEGPFYREGIPIRSMLDVHGDAGIALYLHGAVLDSHCEPIANAVLELWHASPIGPAARPGEPDATYDTTGEYRYYGQTASDASGRYSFRTLRPGWYLNGSRYRPAHLHVKIWLGDAALALLTTQLYFTGDPFNETDEWFNPEMQLDPDASGDVSFDFIVGG